MKVTNKNYEKNMKLSDEEKKYFSSRLNVIEGQIRGIKQMIDEDRQCGDVLVQLSAVNSSLKSVGEKLLKRHLDTCVVRDIKKGKSGVTDEIIDLFDRLG